MMHKNDKIIIIGAGPCGLGAAWRLNELGYSNYKVFEKNDYIGGLSASFVDEQKFTWDIGGHIQFSHYDYFDEVMQTVISPENWIAHERESWIWMRDRFIPYPLQYNIGRLPAREMQECLDGLIACRDSSAHLEKANFLEWILHSFGEGLAKHFLIPYNKKVWAYLPEDLDPEWIGDRVAVPDVNRIMDNITSGRDDCSWGPNNTFNFPLHGGTGAIWRGVAERIPRGKIFLGAELFSWDTDRKVLKFTNGIEHSYDYLISTMPLDLLLEANNSRGLGVVAGKYIYSSTNIIGVGLKGEVPEKLRTKCWMYFPEDDNPFYRVTVFSNYSCNNVPPGGYWSLMGEVSESPKKPVNQDTLIDSVINGFKTTKLIESNAHIVSTWSYRAEYAYPTPFLGRNEILDKMLAELQKKNVYSRGRFGAWKYECSNQDHVFMQGVEAVENILFGTPEITLKHPTLVNTHRIR